MNQYSSIYTKNPKLDITRPSRTGLERFARCTQERYTLEVRFLGETYLGEMFWAILGCTRWYWAVLGCTLLYWDVLGSTELYWAVPGGIGLYWDVMGGIGLYWAVVGGTRLYWAILDCTKNRHRPPLVSGRSC